MAGFANNFNDNNLIDLLPPDSRQAVLAVFDKEVAYYNTKLLNLNPYDFKTTEEFLRKWQFYKGSLEAINDLITLMKGKQDADWIY